LHSILIYVAGCYGLRCDAIYIYVFVGYTGFTLPTFYCFCHAFYARSLPADRWVTRSRGLHRFYSCGSPRALSCHCYLPHVHTHTAYLCLCHHWVTPGYGYTAGLPHRTTRYRAPFFSRMFCCLRFAPLRTACARCVPAAAPTFARTCIAFALLRLFTTHLRYVALNFVAHRCADAILLCVAFVPHHGFYPICCVAITLI